jgi:ubiquinone/menaquinone biosynthesis C-methylase UbiE
MAWEQNFTAFYRHLVDFHSRRIIDIGCGNGGKTICVASMGPEFILGLDIDPVKLAYARQYSLQCGMHSGSCEFLAGDAANLPFATGSFDLAISEDGFEHFPDPEGVLREVNRILLPGGRFLIHFATYYTAVGPHLYNFIRVPRAHYFFSDAAMIEATRQIAMTRQYRAANTPQTSMLETPTEQAEREIYQFEHFINRMTLRGFKKILTRSPDWKLVAFHRYCTNRRIGLLLEFPYVAELFGAVICVMEKSPGVAINHYDFSRARARELPRVLTSHNLCGDF